MIHCWTVHSSQRNQQKLSLSEFNSTQHERRIAKAYANDQIGIATKLHLNTEIITDSKDLGTNCSVAQDFMSENIYKLPGFIPSAEFPSRLNATDQNQTTASDINQHANFTRTLQFKIALGN